MNSRTQENWIYALLSGLLLGFAFPPSPFYSIAYVAFIPFFFLFEKTDSYLKLFGFTYLFLFIFKLITAYWISGIVVGKDVWMMIAGIAFIFAHPFFYMPFIFLAFTVRKKLGLTAGLMAFALFWTSFEYLHSLGEYSFPWFTIGNCQAYDIYRIQLIEYTSVYGLSVLILSFNIIAFLLLHKLTNTDLNLRSRQSYLYILVLLLIYFLPTIYGSYVIKIGSQQDNEVKMKVGIIQPNFDPWEKWGEKDKDSWDSYMFQFSTLIDESKKISKNKPDLIIWPETAIPFHILLPRYSNYLFKIQSVVDSMRTPIFTGLPTAEYFNENNAPATSQKIGNSNLYVESYNSSVLFQPNQTYGPIHKKTILVPFAERIPYAETFKFLIEPLKWNVGISSWGKGEDTVVNELKLKNNEITRFSGMICYESVFPQYVREFIKRGAEFLVIITNDSWWGNTSGAYQHASFAVLRAIETRRWVVQCSNGGISLVVNPYGEIQKETKLYTVSNFVDEIGIRRNETFYVRHGDVFAQSILIISFLLIIALMIKSKIYKRQ